MALIALEPFVPVMEAAAEPFVQPVLAGAVKVLPRWADEDGVTKWRLKYRPADGEEDGVGRPGSEEDGRAWIELELRSFTRELPLTGLHHGVPHLFKAAVQTPYGWSDWSSIVACTPPSPSLPGKCATVYATVQEHDTAVVRWTKAIDYAASVRGGEITKYRIRVAWPVPGHALGETDPSGERLIDVGADTDVHVVDGLKSLTDYRFQVAAMNTTGWGDFSDPSAALTMPPPVPPKLNQPTLRRATHHTVVIQWCHPPASTSVPLDSFRFRWTTILDTVKSKSIATNEDWSGEVPVFDKHDVPPNTSQFLIEGLEPSTTYVFQVRALNKFGMGIWSDSSIPIKTLDGCAPSQIAGLQVPHIYKSFITLQWSPAAENGYPVVQHLLKYSLNGDMSDGEEIVPTVVRKAGVDTCDLRHLSKTKCFFQVAAINAAGVSDWSTPASVDLSVVPSLEDA